MITIMKRMMILLLIACSTCITTNAQQKKTAENVPYNVKALFWDLIKSWGNSNDEIYVVNKNPNTNQIELSVKITNFVANVNTGTVRQNMSAIGEAFKKDEPKSYQLLHLTPGNNERFSLTAVDGNGQVSTFRVRTSREEEMWLLCAKNPENPKLRDAYAIKWQLNDNKTKAHGTIYQITSLRPDYYEQSARNLDGFGGQLATSKTFRIDGRVGDDLTDSLYVVYMAPTADSLDHLRDDDYVANMPVVNRRFSFSVEIEKPMVGRIRTVMPDGSLCKLWTNLDFVPGETYHITTHNGFYEPDDDYERRVGRYSGKSLLNNPQIAGIDDIDTVAVDTFTVVDRGEVLPGKNLLGTAPAPLSNVPDVWEKNITPEQERDLLQKGMALKSSAEALHPAYEYLLTEIVKTNDSFDLGKTNWYDDTYKNVLRLNKELDKNFHTYIKALKAVNVPSKELVGGYREMLKLFTEQNKAFNEIFKKTGRLTKAAQKTQRYVIKLTEIERGQQIYAAAEMNSC